MEKYYKNALEIVFAFVIAFLVYQGIAQASGTPIPIVTVVSESMVHGNHFNMWWESPIRGSDIVRRDAYQALGISGEEFKRFPLANGLAVGDLVVITAPVDITVGDVVTYLRQGETITIIHRVVEINGNMLVTRGDNNAPSDDPITKSQVIGKAQFAVPLLGYPRLGLFEIEKWVFAQIG